MNNPTCAQCDCVAGCQANPKACPNLVVQSVQAPTSEMTDIAEILADALSMLVGNNGVHSLCRHQGIDPMGRVKGTWSAAAEINAKVALAIFEKFSTELLDEKPESTK